MANKFPLILNTSANQIQEIASGDNLDLTGCGINNAGVITATTFVGNLTGNLTGNSTGTIQTAAQPNITSLGTLSALNVSGNVSIGGTLTYEDVTNIDSVGIVTAREGVFLPDTKELKLGNTAASPDLKLYSTGTNGWVFTPQSGADLYMGTNAGEVYIQTGSGGNDTAIKVNSGGSVDLYHNNQPKVVTTSYGIRLVDNYVEAVQSSTSTPVLRLGDTGVANYDFTFPDNATIKLSTNTTSTKQFELRNAGSGNFDLLIADNGKIKVGDSNDLSIYHNGSHSFLENGTGALVLKGSDVNIQSTGGVKSLYAYGSGIELNYSGNKKIETQANGVTVTGGVYSDGLICGDSDKVELGTGADLSLYANGSDSYIDHSGDGNLYIRTLGSQEIIRLNAAKDIEFRVASGNDIAAKFIGDGACELYHNNQTRLTTTSFGVQIEAEPKIDLVGSGNSVEIKFIGNSSSHRGSVYADNGNTIGFLKAGTGSWAARWHNDGKQTAHGHIVPNANDTYNLGTASLRWSTIYSNNALNTSDRNQKNTIIESDLGLDFVNKLKPVSYKWNKDDGKTHYGLIAQDIEETVLTEGKKITDCGFIDKPEEGQMSLAYSELISPLIKAVQELSAKVAALEGS